MQLGEKRGICDMCRSRAHVDEQRFDPRRAGRSLSGSARSCIAGQPFRSRRDGHMLQLSDSLNNNIDRRVSRLVWGRCPHPRVAGLLNRLWQAGPCRFGPLSVLGASRCVRAARSAGLRTRWAMLFAGGFPHCLERRHLQAQNAVLTGALQAVSPVSGFCLTCIHAGITGCHRPR